MSTGVNLAQLVLRSFIAEIRAQGYQGFIALKEKA
jgi:hypothetical protein